MKKSIGDAAFVLSLILGAVLFYVALRYHKSTPVRVREYFQYAIPAPPIRCPLVGDAIDGANAGWVYLSGKNMRVDWEQVMDGVHRRAHAVSLDGDVVYTWNDQNIEAFTASSSVFSKEFIDPKPVDGTCSPWWIPRSMMFEIPNTLEFAPYKNKKTL